MNTQTKITIDGIVAARNSRRTLRSKIHRFFKFRLNIKDFFRNIKYGIRNYLKWAKIIYNDRDWDWSYLYQLIEFKLLKMAQLHRKHGSCTNSIQVAEEMEEAALYLRNLYEDEYCTEFYDANGYRATLEKQKLDLRKFCELFEGSKRWWE